MKLLVVVVAALAAGTGAARPAELLTDDVPSGFELADGAVDDLTFDEYAPLAPEAIAHVDATSADAAAMRAAVDVWTAGDGAVLLREVTMWNSDEAARAFVEQAVVVGATNELDEADPPFPGGVAFLGADEGLWTRTLSWRQGPYAVTLSHYAIAEGTDEQISDAAASLADRIESTTGHTIAAGGVLSQPADTTQSTGTDGISIGTWTISLVMIVGAIWLFVKIKRNVAARPAPDRAAALGEDAGESRGTEHQADDRTPAAES